MPLTAYFKSRPARSGGGWMAWAGLQLLVTDNPAMEPAEPIYFTLKPTQDEAEKELFAEMEEKFGPLRWWRQAV